MKTIDRLAELLNNIAKEDNPTNEQLAQYLIDNGVIFKDKAPDLCKVEFSFFPPPKTMYEIVLKEGTKDDTGEGT